MHSSKGEKNLFDIHFIITSIIYFCYCFSCFVFLSALVLFVLLQALLLLLLCEKNLMFVCKSMCVANDFVFLLEAATDDGKAWVGGMFINKEESKLIRVTFLHTHFCCFSSFMYEFRSEQFVKTFVSSPDCQ